MKLNKLINGWRILAALAIAMSAAACSDGELAPALDTNITPPPPVIITFAADPSTVKSGGSTTISWEVAGADSVEIAAVSTGAAPNFHVTSQELSGSAQATGLTASTDFVLTAKKTSAAVTEEEGGADATKSGQIPFGPDESGGVPAPQPSESAVTQTITVTVISGEIATTITTDKSPVAACDETIIRWTSEGTSTVVSADSGEAIVAKDQCPQTDLAADIAAIKAAPAVDPMPANGCAVVKPCAKTVYTVNATDGSGGAGTASVTIDVNGDVSAKIYAGKTESEKTENQLKVDSIQNPVFISWKVEPAGAKVTVMATPAATCDPVLPADATDKAESSSKCTLTAETKFTITATVGTKTDTDEVDVVLTSATGAGLVIAEKWALEGEKIGVEMSLDDATKLRSDIVNKVLVNNTEIPTDLMDKLRNKETVVVPNVLATPPFVTVKMVYNKTQEAKYQPIPVVELAVKRLDDDVKSITSMAIAPDEMTRYTGVQLSSGFNSGVARLYKDGGAINFQFGDPIMEAFGMKDAWHNDWNEGFFKALGTYPVAVAIREGKPGEIYASATGGDMRSKDGGDTWENIRVSRVQQTPGFVSASHPTCGRSEDGAQKTQAGVQPRFEYDIISLSQTCAVLALKDGLVVLGTDWGVRYEENIDDENWLWQGKPPVGQSGDATGKPTYGYVVNDLEKADNKIFAAAENGIFVSEDKAVTWKAFGSIPTPVWALAYDARNKTLYAGTNDGVYASTVDSASWAQKGMAGEAAISLAVDPKNRTQVDSSSSVGSVTVIAGTSKGVKITRDGGATPWQELVLKDGEQAVQAVAIAAKDGTNDTVSYVIALGTSAGGELFQNFSVSAQAKASGELEKSQLSLVGTPELIGLHK